MPTYVLPQVLVFQEAQPIIEENSLHSHISGGHAFLVRFNEPTEQRLGFLDFYDNLLDREYLWPNLPANAIVDQSYTKVWIKDALLQYFESFMGGGDVITKMASYNNRIHSAALNFRVNGVYARSAEFIDRDVQIGDIAKIRGLDVFSNPITLFTYVKDIHGDIVPAIIDPAVSDVNNAATQSASAVATQIAGPINGVVAIPDGSGYNGLATGHINETYDIIITESSAGQDYTVARARVLSGSGTDDQLEITPAPKGTPSTIGTRGLLVTFDDDDLASSSASALVAGVPVDELIVGQRFHVVVAQAFTMPLPTSGGTYVEDEDTTYIVDVSLGGFYGAGPTISVTTTTGIDISGPTVVPAAATAIPIGTRGVTIAFSGVALRKGDRYYVTITGAKEGPMKQLEFGANLSTDIPSGSEVDLTLFILKPSLQVPENREGFAPLVNWEQSASLITLKAGVIAFDTTWTDLGIPQPLPVLAEPSKNFGELFVEYRAWRDDLCSQVFSIASNNGAAALLADLNVQISGPLHPDNPLKWGVFKALENANGAQVRYTGVCNPDDLDEWVEVLSLLLGRDDVYGLVPLTRDQAVLDLFVAHVRDQSTPEQAQWRVLWTNLQGIPEIPVVSTGSTIRNHLAATTTDGLVALCVIEDDPFTTGSQFTILRCTSANADFISNGVRAGDIVRTLYTGDGFGNFTYSEFVVDEVISEDQLRLLVGPGGPVTVGSKTEIWRNLTATEEAAELALVSAAWGDHRVRSVWPDQIESFGTIMEGYHLCAALAALASGVLPHQGLTHVALAGFSDVSRTTQRFNRAQLDVMAGSGTWIVTQDVLTSAIFTRHAVTTADNSDLNKREEMIVRNVDSISFRFKDHFAPFIGITNITDGTIARIGTEVHNLTSLLQVENSTPNLGGQLIDALLLELRRSVTLRDRIVLRLAITVPVALNNLELHLII